MTLIYKAFRSELLKVGNGDEDMSGPAPSQDAVIKFLDKHPRPTDKQFHSWAESAGYNVHKAEATVYRVLSDMVNTGKSKGKMPAGTPKKEIKQGVKIEKEHTPNPTIARKVVADHVTETGPGYYPALVKMEKKLEKKGGLYGSFRSELLKIAMDDGLFPVQEDEVGPDAIETPQDGGMEEPASTPGPPLREDETGAADSVGDLASMDARRSLEGLLKNDEGKRAIRETLNKLDRSSQEVGTLKKALTRGLLRARREVYGPTRDPVQNLNEILEGNTFAPQPT
jgi:hypothetical protein